VTDQLFDPEVDGFPLVIDVRGGIKPNQLKMGTKQASSPEGGAAPGATFGEWLAGASLSGVVGLGLAAGLLVAVPLAMVLQSTRSRASRPANPPSIVVAKARPFQPPTLPRRSRPFVGPPAPRSLVVPPAAVAAPARTAPAAAAPAPAPAAAPAAVVVVARERDGDEAPIAAVEKPRPAITMGTVMDGVRRTTDSTNWQLSGLADRVLMRSLDVIIGEIRRATGDPTWDLPVRFGTVPPGLGDDPGGVIHVAMCPALFDRSVLYPTPVVLDAGRAYRSILIADGDFVLTSAEDCVILATGAVQVSYPTRCFIIAGRLIEASHDTASVLISGSRLSVSHCYTPWRPPSRWAIYSAPDLVTIANAAHVIFLNSGRRHVSHQSGCRPLDWPALDFDDVNRDARPIAWKGRIAAIRGSRRHPDGGFDLRVEGVADPIHVEIGSPIIEPGGQIVPELAGWQAYRSTTEYVMLYKGRRLMELPMDSRGIKGLAGR
jgi:hypothetical protein